MRDFWICPDHNLIRGPKEKCQVCSEGWTCMCGERIAGYKPCPKCKNCKRHYKGICDAGPEPVEKENKE